MLKNPYKVITLYGTDKPCRFKPRGDIGIYSMEVSVSRTKQYSVIIYLPKRMAPTWERLHEKQLKAVIEVGDDGGY